MSLPLQRIPHLALAEIVKCLDPSEILPLIQTSRKTRNLVQKCSKIHPIHVKIVDGTFFSAVELRWGQIGLMSLPVRVALEDLKVKTSWYLKETVPAKFSRGRWITYWRSTPIAFESILHFLRNFYKIVDVTFDITKINSAKIFKIIDRFHEFSKIHLKIDNASWLTVEQCQALVNCDSVEVDGVYFDGRDINEILKHWMRVGGKLKMLKFHINLHYGINLDNVIRDINVVHFEKGRLLSSDTFWITGQNDARYIVVRDFMGTVIIASEADL